MVRDSWYFNILMYGTPREVLDVLDHVELDEAEVRAALTNLFRRQMRLEEESRS